MTIAEIGSNGKVATTIPDQAFTKSFNDLLANTEEDEPDENIRRLAIAILSVCITLGLDTSFLSNIYNAFFTLKGSKNAKRAFSLDGFFTANIAEMDAVRKVYRYIPSINNSEDVLSFSKDNLRKVNDNKIETEDDELKYFHALKFRKNNEITPEKLEYIGFLNDNR